MTVKIAFKMMIGLLLPAALLFATPGRSDQSRAPTQLAGMGLIVPAYFYPGRSSNHWRSLIEGARQVPLTIVINPADGPGRVLDPNYRRVAGQAREAGARLVGYVHTDYTRRRLPDVLDDLSRFARLYPINGFFIDEMASDSTAKTANYYQAIYRHAKSLGQQFQVIGNPGTDTPDSYLQIPLLDVVVGFESPLSKYSGFQAVSDQRADPAVGKLAHLIYGAATAQNMRNAVRLAAERNASMVFVTQFGIDSPWDELPDYWRLQVECIANINRGSDC